MPALQGARGMTSRRQSGPPTRASKRHQGPEGGQTPLGTHLHIPGVAARGCGRTLAREAHPCSEAMATQVVVPSGPPVEASSYVRGHPFEDTMCSKAPHSKQRRLRSDWPGAGTRPHPTRERWLARGPRRQGRGKSILAPALRHQLSSQPPGVGGQASRLVVEARAAVGRACSRLSRRPGSQQGQSRGDLPPTPTPGCGWLPQFSNSSATSGRVATANSPRPRRHRSQATVSNSSPPPHPRTGCPMTCP